MDKEKKKMLLVAVSVGVFLVIAISAAILILTPKAPANGTAFTSARPISAGSGESPLPKPASVDPAEMVKNADSLRGIQTPPAAPEFPAKLPAETNSSGELPAKLPAENPAKLPAVVPSAGISERSQVTINVPKPSAAAVPDTPAETVSRAASAKPAAAAAPARAAPAAAKPAPAKSAVIAKPVVRTGAQSVQSKKLNDYWVQTGAFSAKVRAEGAKETLADKGIVSIIEPRDIDGKTWYRVRVGPYTSESEANYWLALVKSIDGFTESQVRQTVR